MSLLIQITFICLLSMLSQYYSLEILTFINNTDTYLPIFTTNKTTHKFNHNLQSSGSCCQVSKLYQEEAEHLISNFTIFKDENISIDKELTFDSMNITANLIKNKHSTNNDTQIPIETYTIEGHSTILQLQLFNICSIDSSSSDSARLVNVTFQYSNTSYSFYYIKLCNDNQSSPKLLSHITMLLLLLSIMMALVYITSHFSIETSLIVKHKGIIYLKWWYGAILLIIGIFTVIFIHFFDKFSFKLICPFSIVLLLIAIYKSSVIFFKIILHISRINKKIKKFITKETFNVKRYRLLSIFISISLVILWILFHNWILSDVLVFICVFAFNQSFSFNNFPNLLMFLSCFMSYDVFWFCTQFYFKQFYNMKSLEVIDQPIKLTMPKLLQTNLLHPCYFISLIDIVIVSELIKYSKCFDVIKGYTSYPYYKTSRVLFLIGTIVVIAVQSVIRNDQIHLFPIQILLITGMTIQSALNHDVFDFWNGKNIEGIQKAVDDIISNESSIRNNGRAMEGKEMGYNNNYENTNNYDNTK